MSQEEQQEWYWCLHHERVEPKGQCPASRLMGPYETREAAQAYAQRADARNEAWEADDRAWKGEHD